MAINPWWAPWVLNRMIDPLTRNVRIQAAELAGMKTGEKALDICCGTGALALHYARIGVIATGVDQDPRVVQVADRKRRKQGLSNASFQTANALNLPFEDSHFDHASISMAVHEVGRAERDRIISEMKRVVKKEGSLIFIDYKVPLPPIPSSYTSRVVELVSGREHNRCFKDYIQQGGLDELLKKHGLREGARGELGPMTVVQALNSKG
jgi:ubiquinone/menaquinone biosynthesis C-methylase UbiE